MSVKFVQTWISVRSVCNNMATTETCISVKIIHLSKCQHLNEVVYQCRPQTSFPKMFKYGYASSYANSTEPPDTLSSMSDIASVLSDQGKYEQEEEKQL